MLTSVSDHYQIRLLRKEEIPELLELCKNEGRHMGLEPEVESWFNVDPYGFYIAVSDQGEILGSCCGIRLSPAHGNLGMYVVRSEYRGVGIGKQLWNAAIEHLGHRNKGLSAVPDLFTVYRDKAGFSFVSDWSVDLYRLERPAVLRASIRRGMNGFRETVPYIPPHLWHQQRITNPVQAPDIYDNAINYYSNDGLSSKLRTLPVTRSLVQDVVAYDSRLHSYDRSKIVELTLTERNCHSRVAVKGQKILGYGCLKPNLQGLWMISPLYADNEAVARLLVLDLMGSLSASELGEGVVLKAPSNNQAAVDLLNSLGFERQTYSLKRCYTQFVWKVPNHVIFAFHTSVFCSE